VTLRGLLLSGRVVAVIKHSHFPIILLTDDCGISSRAETD